MGGVGGGGKSKPRGGVRRVWGEAGHPTQKSFIMSVGFDKRIIDISWILHKLLAILERPIKRQYGG